MPKKPTYEELEQRVKKFEQEHGKLKQAEKRLLRESTMRDVLLDNLPCVALILKKDTREIVASNQAAKQIGAVPGKTCYETCAQRDDNCPFCLAPELWATGDPQHLEVEHEGTYYEGIWVPLTEELYVHYIIDITERKRTEEALLESENNFRALAENVNDGILIAIDDGAHIFANQRASEITGYTTSELLSATIKDLAHPDEFDRIIEIYKKIISGKPFPRQYETMIINKDGEVVPVEVSSAKTVWQGKSADIVSIRDITKRQQMDRALQEAHDELEQRVEERTVELFETNEHLKESEKRFRQLAEGTFEAVVLHEEGVILEANEQFYEMVGYNPEELTGKDAISLTTTPESAENIREQISLDNLGPYEITGVKKDGTKFPMESRIKLIEYKGRKLRMAAIRDLTEARLNEKVLRESEERFRDTATMLPSAIIESGLDGILTYVNPHGYKLAGYVPEDFEEGFNVLRLVAPEEHAKHYERIQRMMQGEKIPPTEYRLLGKDGSIFWGLVTSSLIHKDGEAVGVRTYTIDISERKEAEEALKERTRELELQKKSLEELNTAMKVLLKKRKEDKTEIEENVMTNVKKLITPYFVKTQKTELDDHQKVFLNILESNLNEIVSPFTRKLSLKYLSLTPKEITIVNMIKQGYTTKKIAKLMKISPRTVDTHRKNIRSKIGLNKIRGNLRSHLLAYEQ
jgi:PAS domain S-box-containing protein